MPNYTNNIPINIVERHLPRGLETWREVAAVYHLESNETTLCQGEDLRDIWNKKLCNHMQKPTGKPGALTDHIFRCLAIERRIQDKANAAILGANLAKSSHGRDDGSSLLSDESNNNNIPAAAREGVIPMLLLILARRTAAAVSLLMTFSLITAEAMILVRMLMRRWLQST